MKKMLSARKVLVVLDDVDNIDQLKALAGEPNWFKPGSRIIITTREEQVLVAHRVNFIREEAICFIRDVNLLSPREAICLFSRNAFGTESPIQGYEELSEEVVCYAAGLPLTVSVLGSFLCGRSVLEWKDALERLKTIPLEETLQKLELSYNGLANDYKEIFLDVACIFKGWEKDKAIRALESCGFRAEIGLKILEQKSLITISDSGYLGMHDHIEEMGKNIVRRLLPNEPYKHSRLWKREEIEDILDKDQGTEATRCINLVNFDLHPATIMKGLRNMKGLRFLHVEDYVTDDDDFLLEDMESYVLDALRCLHWDWYPLTCLPKIFEVNNVVQLQMRGSNMRQLWDGGERKVLDRLTYIDLSNSYKLRTLDLGPTPNLETLILRSCDSLVEVHMYSKTPKLEFLDLSDNIHLRIINLGRSPNLEVLSLKNCGDLEELHMCGETPKLEFLDLSDNIRLRIIHLGRSPNLEVLSLDNCGDLEELHMCGETPKLEFLDLSNNIRLRIVHLGRSPNLEVLSLNNCHDLEELHMPGGTVKLKSLDFFSLSKLRTLDLWQSLNLEKLDICECENLIELRMPAELKSLSVQNSRLRTLNLAQIRNLEEILMKDCKDLVELIMPVESLSLRSLQLIDSNLRTLDLASTPNLETLHLYDCVNLVELHMPVESLKLKYLELSNSMLRTLDLARTPNLETLYLDECEHLVELRLQVVCSLRCLRELTLDSCCPELPKDLHQLECLEKLTLSSTKVKHLPSSICMLKHLKVLKLVSCFHLEGLPADVGRLECLEELYLSSKKIKQLPNSICMMKQLKVLNLENCYLLEHLVDDLGRLECLESLILNGCKSLQDIPNSICQMKHLENFQLKFCILVEKLPEELGRLECLKYLFIDYAGISHLPRSIFRLKGLRIYGRRWQLELYGLTNIKEDHRYL